MTTAIICSLKVNFPFFYKNLLQEHDLIEYFIQLFDYNSTRFEDLPPRIQFTLKDLVDLESNDKLKPEYNSLRRYLRSLSGHRWPKSLQPFLLLTQNATSRSYSTRDANIHDALVSADVTGYLKELGRDNDSRPLSNDDKVITSDIIEDLLDDSDIRKENAVFVIAKIFERIPNIKESKMLPQLCKELDRSRDFRSRVGIEKITSILQVAHFDDQSNIISRLINDTCGEEKFQLMLTTNQPPSLDEASQMTQDVIKLALSLWQGKCISRGVKGYALFLDDRKKCYFV